LDNWQTTSEVVCRHVCTLPALPSPFPPERPNPGVPVLTWDRFSFLVRLEDVERKLAERTIYFAARYQANGVGEWWDNNAGSNYKLVFKKSPQNSVPSKGPSPLRNSEGPNPKKIFPGLDLRPMTMSLDSADSGLPPLKLKRPPGGLGAGPASPGPKSTPSAPATSTTSVFAAPPGPNTTTTTNGIGHQRTPSSSSNASSGSSSSLKFSNYASPVSPVPALRPGISSHGGNRNSISMFLNGGNMAIIGGQPVSLPSSPDASKVSPNSSMLSIPGSSSPLVQKRSPTNSILSSVSPASAGPPVTPASPFPATSSNPPSPSRSPHFGTSSSTSSSATAIPRKSPSPIPASGFPTNDSSYAALVEKWCFHESPPPGSAITVGSPSSETSTPGLSAAGRTAKGPFGAFESGANGYGSGYGYTHHHIGKTVSLKP
jgi:hypothetical protein